LLETIRDNILSNAYRRLEILHLGRAEDWIVFEDEPKYLEVENLKYGRLDSDYKIFSWIPEKIYQFKNRKIDYNDFDGIIYNLPVFSEIENYSNAYNHRDKRSFSYMRTKLNDGLISKTNVLLDDSSDLDFFAPIFLGDFQLAAKK